MRHGGRLRYARMGRGGLQCVTYARSATGIELTGNAANWWDNAAGTYARGNQPEPGSVLNFRANGHMRLGHVAVVTNVVNAREIEIEHANWAGPGARRGGVSRGIPVVDISPNNDWTAVRVGLGQSGEFGSIYPTYGFIYDRPDSGVIEASATTSAVDPAPELNPAPRDLREPQFEAGHTHWGRPRWSHGHLLHAHGTRGRWNHGRSGIVLTSLQAGGYDEVAEAPATARHAIVLPPVGRRR